MSSDIMGDRWGGGVSSALLDFGSCVPGWAAVGQDRLSLFLGAYGLEGTNPTDSSIIRL